MLNFLQWTTGKSWKSSGFFVSKSVGTLTTNVHILLHAEFSATDYTLNIVSKCRFFSLYFNIRGLRKGPGKFFMGSWKSPGFFVSKRVGTLTMLPRQLGTGSPFRGSAIPGIRVGLGLRLRLSLVDLRNGGPPEWRTGIHQLCVLCVCWWSVSVRVRHPAATPGR